MNKPRVKMSEINKELLLKFYLSALSSYSYNLNDHEPEQIAAFAMDMAKAAYEEFEQVTII